MTTKKNTLVFYISFFVHMYVDVDWVDDSVRDLCNCEKKFNMWYHCTKWLKTDVYYISPCIFTHNKHGRRDDLVGFFLPLGFVWSIVWDYEIFHFFVKWMSKRDF